MEMEFTDGGPITNAELERRLLKLPKQIADAEREEFDRLEEFRDREESLKSAEANLIVTTPAAEMGSNDTARKAYVTARTCTHRADAIHAQNQLDLARITTRERQNELKAMRSICQLRGGSLD